MLHREFERKLIEEVRQDGREFLYHRQHLQYKNNLLKKTVWGEIGSTMGLSAAECMECWKAIRARYVRILNTPIAFPLNPRDAWLAKVMIFMKDQISPESGEENEQSITFPPVAQTGPKRTSKVMLLDDGSKVIIQSRPQPILLPEAVPTNFLVKDSNETVKSMQESSFNDHELETEVLEDVPIFEAKSTKLSSPKQMTKTSERQNCSANTDYGPFDMFGKYVAAELRHLPKRQAIIMQQELQNALIRTKLSFLEPTDHIADSPYRQTNSSNDGSKDYDGLSQTMITTFGANDE